MMKARIASPDFWYQVNEHFGTGGGIYMLSCMHSEKAEEPMAVERLLGEDQDGVLYIGMALSFLDRVINLKKSLSPQHISRAHECGARYKGHSGICHRFPYERLLITFDGAGDARAAEREALQTYMQKFGELPPLNRAG